MKHTSIRRTTALPALGLAFILATATHAAMAQEPAAKPAATDSRATAEVRAEEKPTNTPVTASGKEESQTEAAPAEYEPEPLQIGDATQNLLAWQRGGELASATPRPIAGNVANRSYERYLKSFEFPIPERMVSSVKSSNSSGSR